MVQTGDVSDFTEETATVFLEVDANREPLVVALEKRGIVVTWAGQGLYVKGPDELIYDQVRDALVKAEAPLRRMVPRRRALTELFERDGEDLRSRPDA